MATYGDAGTTAGLVAPLLFWNQGNPCLANYRLN